MPHTNTDTDAAPQAWRVSAWLRALGNPFSRAMVYHEIRAGRVQARKAGRNTLIVTSPRDYLASLPTKLGPPVRDRSREARKAAGAAV
jgi:hypothetical protein